MKYLALIVLIVFSACTTKSYTSSEYFDCYQNNEFKPVTEKQRLIYKMLTHAVVNVKDLPNYGSLKDKKNIYISKIYYSKFTATKESDIIKYEFENTDIPTVIKDVRFCIKSEEQLQKIADNTTEFIYLTFGNIEINDSVATIGICTSCQSPTNSKIVYSSSGYVIKYKKIDGDWIYDRILLNWIS